MSSNNSPAVVGSASLLILKASSGCCWANRATCPAARRTSEARTTGWC